MTLRIRAFGHLQVTDGGASNLGHFSKRAKRLLAYLLLHRNTPTPRESIAFSLWPGIPEKDALGQLRRALSELRKTLAELDQGEWILTIDGDIQWNSHNEYWLDISDYEASRKNASVEALHTAADLYTGDLLSDIDEEWVVIERERLRQAQGSILEQLATHYRALGDYDCALRFAGQLVDLNPLSEVAHRQWISLHYLNGDRMAATGAYKQLCTILQNELDIEPMPETQAVYEAIKNKNPLPTQIEKIPPKKTDQKIPLPQPIGRETEMAELGKLWLKASQGQGTAVLISGIAGIGKSYLAQNLADFSTQQGGHVLLGHCYEFERAVPYQAIIELLRSAKHILPHINILPAHRAIISQVAPDLLGATRSINDDQILSESESRLQLFEALLQICLGLARIQPTLFVLEDTHWASNSTLDWLTYIIPHLADSNILLTITYRSEEIGTQHSLARMQRRNLRTGLASSFILPPLSQEANHDLVTKLSGLESVVVTNAAKRIYQETLGNPFYLHEMIRELISAGHIILNDGIWSGTFLKDALELEIQLPKSLLATINGRAARLSLQTKSFIQSAAVAGRVFDFEVVKQAGELELNESLAALDDLLRYEFILPNKVEGQYLFNHHLVREAIYSGLSPSRRNHLHKLVGTTIENLHPGNEDILGDLAYHFFRGQVWQKALEYAEAAAHRAEKRFADGEAIYYYDLALDALRNLPQKDPKLQFDLLTCRLRSEEREGDYERMLSSLEEMEKTARSTDDVAILAGALYNRGRFLRKCGQYRQALPVLEECIELIKHLNDQTMLAPALVERGRTNFGGLRIQKSFSDLQQALAIFDNSNFFQTEDGQVQHAAAWREMGTIHVRTGSYQQSIDAFNRSLAILQSHQNVRSDEVVLTKLEFSYCMGAMGATQFSLNILEDALDTLHLIDFSGLMVEAHLLEMIIKLRTDTHHLTTTRETAHNLEKVGQWQSRPNVKGQRHALLAWEEFDAGHAELAFSDMQIAINIFQEMGDIQSYLLTLPVLAFIHIGLGQIERAFLVTSEAIELLGNNSGYSEPYIYHARYLALSAQKNYDEAQIFAQKAYQTLRDRVDLIKNPELRQEIHEFPLHTKIYSAWKDTQIHEE